jgi:hypothetical protein
MNLLVSKETMLKIKHILLIIKYMLHMQLCFCIVKWLIVNLLFGL